MEIKEKKVLNRIIILDFIRGISALLVLLGHLRAIMFIDYSQLLNPNAFEKFFYFITGLGHSAVMVFFVMSGFFVGGTLLKRNFKLELYLASRFSRLWAALISALLFTCFIDTFLNIYFPKVILGGHHLALASGPMEGYYSLSLTTFFLNLFFLQTIFVPIFGSNGPLWSLANEFWYYILFPLLLITFGVIHKVKILRIFCFALVVLISFFVAKDLLEGFLIWLMGVAVFIIYDKELRLNKWILPFSTIFFLACLVNSKFPILGNYLFSFNDLLIGISFSLMMLSIININMPSVSNSYFKSFSIWLSEISYTLYIFHFPLLLVIYSFYYSDEQLLLGASSIAQFLGWILLVLVISQIFWWLFERNTAYLKKMMLKIYYRLSEKLKFIFSEIK